MARDTGFYYPGFYGDFAASIVIWVLQSFDLTWHQVADSGDSMLAGFGKILAPIFAPLGFGDWRCSTALVTAA